MKIWAHRGCSQRYPENTLLAFEKAAGLKGLTGIELDIQLSKDGEIVVIHDEMVDRTTNGTGYVKDHTLTELKGLKIDAGNGQYEQIAALGEVLELLETEEFSSRAQIAAYFFAAGSNYIKKCCPDIDKS